MSILLASATVVAQLCYVAENDPGSHEFLQEAQALHSTLLAMTSTQTSGCIDLSDKTYLEAQRLVATDSSNNTLQLKK